MFRILLVVAVGGALACAAAKPAPHKDSKPRHGLERRSRVLHLDPIRIVADPSGKTRIEEVDVQGEFNKAADLYEAAKYGAALKAYLVLAHDVGGTPNEIRALYNAGLCLELLRRFDEALAKYATLIQKAPKSGEARDAEVRRVIALRALGRSRDVADLVSRLLDRTDFEPGDRVELLLWRGVALFKLRDIEEALLSLRSAIERFDRFSQIERLDKALAAQIHFWLGEIQSHRFFTTLLDEARADLTAAMVGKARWLYEARDEYLRGIERGDIYWSAAAAYRIARLYEKMREHVLAMPIPRELNEAQAELYVQELARHRLIEPLVGKATHAYEQVLKLAERTSHKSQWVDKARAAIERLKRLVLKSPVVAPSPLSN